MSNHNRPERGFLLSVVAHSQSYHLGKQGHKDQEVKAVLRHKVSSKQPGLHPLPSSQKDQEKDGRGEEKEGKGRDRKKMIFVLRYATVPRTVLDTYKPETAGPHDVQKL